MRSWFLGLLGLIASALIVFGVIYSQKPPASTEVVHSTSPQPIATPDATPSVAPVTAAADPTPTSQTPDLNVDANGLSKAVVSINTSQGVIKFRFYSNDAPKTVRRIMELITQGFYNGLTFHRVVPGFVVQGGDPVGNGTGGSGQKLPAEFNGRRHVEGAVAMARSSDPDSADSQFYITLGNAPHLDRSYTIFGQVIDGMDIAKKLKVGDKMLNFTIVNQ